MDAGKSATGVFVTLGGGWWVVGGGWRVANGE